MKTAITLLALGFALNLFGQDSASKNELQIGIYVKEKEFLERKPSVTKPFKVVPDPDLLYNSVTGKIDTVRVVRFNYEFWDSTKAKNVYGFFDGENMYWGDTKNGYFKFDYLGRFSFVTAQVPIYSNHWLGPALSVLALGAGIVTIPVGGGFGNSDNRPFVLLYYNKKGKIAEATIQSIYWLIKDDKDFLEDFHAEKKYNNEVFKKYLMKMNERYPE